MSRLLSPSPFALSLLATLLGPIFAHAQGDRRGTMVPGLVLDAGGRHAYCDALLFTPNGNELLAAGDDKVVRTWAVAADGTLTAKAPTLRWSIYREARGSIYTAALSPDAAHVAVGGFGMKNGLCAVLNRADGEVVHTLDDPLSAAVTWKVAFAPSGKYLIIGDDRGQLFRWELGKAGKPTPFAGSAPAKGAPAINRTRLIAFIDRTHFLAVRQDGAVKKWDAADPSKPPVPVGAFTKKDLLRVAISGTAASATRWLAALGDNLGGGGSKEVELVNLTRALAAGAVPAGARQVIRLPRDRAEYPTALAFDDGARLAVGTQLEVEEQDPARNFARVIGGNVRVAELAGGKWQWQGAVLPLGYRTDNIAWRPGHRDQLATAGGPNHEVRTWSVSNARALSEVRTAGSCLYGAAFSADGKYFAWRDRLNTAAPTANARGAGPWQVLEIAPRKRHASPPKGFNPVSPIESQDGWRVEATNNGMLWRVVTPDGTRVPLHAANGLYPAEFNQVPRCYTFLRPVKGEKGSRDKPVRLVVGHMWGASVYELSDGTVRLTRMLTGHEGEVMAVAPSRDGKLLLTASRDQTLCCWSLEDWPNQRELGVRFEKRNGRVFVPRDGVFPGSPGWETDLTDGDELVALVSRDPKTGKRAVYNPERFDLEGKPFELLIKPANPINADGVIDLLARAQPGREYILVYRDYDGKKDKQGKAPLVRKLTTVRQRPLWRFFPTRAEAGGDWVIWRWRDFYYDTTSAQADRLIGWHVNRRDFAKPRFHRLDEYRGSDTGAGPRAATARGFHRPDKVWPTVRDAIVRADKVTFEQIEPPEVRVRVTGKPGKAADLVLNILARPYAGGATEQSVTRLMVWLDDHDYKAGKPPAIVNGAVNGPMTIPRGALRLGPNRITVLAYNANGGRGADAVTVEYDDGTLPVRDLHALCVGISDYTRAKAEGGSWPDLPFATKDAAALASVLEQHAASSLYRQAKTVTVPEKQATAARLIKELKEAAGRVGKDDLFILSLSGHGFAREDKKTRRYDPGSFFFVCADTDTRKPETYLSSKQLYELLAAIPCRKLVILDACHSGDVASPPERDLNRDGLGLMMIMSACRIDQVAREPDAENDKVNKNGFFTLGLLAGLGDAAQARGKRRLQRVSPLKLQESVSRQMRALLKLYKLPLDCQTPVYLIPPHLLREDVLARP